MKKDFLLFIVVLIVALCGVVVLALPWNASKEGKSVACFAHGGSTAKECADPTTSK